MLSSLNSNPAYQQPAFRAGAPYARTSVAPDPTFGWGKKKVDESRADQDGDKKARKPGFFSKFKNIFKMNDGAKEVLRLVLSYGIPFGLVGLTFMSGPLGLILGLASIPIGYFSNQAGKKIGKDIQRDKLPGHLSNLNKWETLLENPTNPEELEKKYNGLVDETIIAVTKPVSKLAEGLSRIPFVGGMIKDAILGIIGREGNAGKIAGLLKGARMLKFVKMLGMGKNAQKIGNRMTLAGSILAVQTAIRQANGPWDAIKKGGKAAMEAFIFSYASVAVGEFVEKLPWGGKIFGTIIKHLGLLFGIKEAYKMYQDTKNDKKTNDEGVANSKKDETTDKDKTGNEAAVSGDISSKEKRDNQSGNDKDTSQTKVDTESTANERSGNKNETGNEDSTDTEQTRPNPFKSNGDDEEKRDTAA